MSKKYEYLSTLFLTAVFAALGSVGAATSLPAAVTQVEKPSQDGNQLTAFNVTILSQNGQRYILRDDVNNVWYHLDDQRRAAKFLGKSVLVTGALDESTVTIHVREIIEAKI